MKTRPCPGSTMGCNMSAQQREAARTNADIDRQLEAARKEANMTVKLLLLGETCCFDIDFGSFGWLWSHT